MTRAIRIVAVLLVLLAATAVALPRLLPVDTWKSTIQARVKAATGRDLRIDGTMRLSLLPRLELKVSDVGLSNAPGASTPEMISLERLRLVIGLLPLLSGRVVVDRFVLDHPVVALEVNADGRPNWKFDTLASPEAAPDAAAKGGSTMELLLEDVRLQEGTIRYTDRRSGPASEATGVALTLSMTGFDDPFHAVGQLTWKQKAVALDATVESPRALLSGGESAVRARIDTGDDHLSYDGSVTAGESPRAAGAVDLDLASMRSTAAWLGQSFAAPAGTFELLKIRGRVEASRGKVSFSDASVTLDGLETSGRVSVATTGRRPRVEANLAVKTLDLRPLLPEAAPSTATGRKTRDGWSDEPFSADGLRSLDAALQLTVGGLVTPRIQTGKGSLTAGLQNGKLTVDIPAIALHEGNAQGSLSVQAQDKGVVAVSCDLHLAGVQLEPLLRDAAGADWLSGRATLDVALAGSGRSVRELVGSFGGKGAVDLRDGSIRGINLAAMVLNVASAFQKKKDGERTEFSQIHGTFRMAEGVLSNSDLTLQSELLQAAGEGSVDFGRRSVDYRVSPKFVAPVVGQLTGGVIGMKVPVLIRGPWGNVGFAPDLVGLLKEGVQAPGALLKGAADFTKGLFGR